MKYVLTIVALAFLVFSAQPSEAVEVLHTYDSMKGDTQELASQYPEIAIYSEQGISTGLDLEIFSVDVALNITELTDEELNALPTNISPSSVKSVIVLKLLTTVLTAF